nr:adenosylmethionine--8-amino-7-oxononanoate transaminase [uncultured Ralstonia sp.]
MAYPPIPHHSPGRADSAPSANAAWQARSRAAVWHPCTQNARLDAMPPLPIARGQGPWLIDFDGKRYLDGTSSWWVNLFGHANPHINAALKTQLDSLEHVMLAGATHRPAVELAERLIDLTGGALGHSFFGSDGASAVEIALKMSFHAHRNAGQGAGRDTPCRFICLEHGYHGETLGALGVTDVAIFRDAYDPLILQSHRVPSPDARLAGPGETAADVAERALAALRDCLSANAGTIAAVIIEPLVQCAAGMAMHDVSYLRGVRALCDEFGVHWIADEIAVGCGRTGTFFACEQAGVWPDLLCLSKGISGGYLPLSIVLSRDAIYNAFNDDAPVRSFLHSHSYTGNPLACRAALATLDLFAEEDVFARNRVTAARIAQGLAPLSHDARFAHLRQTGMITAFDVHPEVAGARFAERFALTARTHGLLLRPIGNTVYLLPPYVLSDEETGTLVDRTLQTLEDTLAQATGETEGQTYAIA